MTRIRPPIAISNCQRMLRIRATAEAGRGGTDRELAGQDDVEDGEHEEEDAQDDGDVEEQALDATADVEAAATRVAAGEAAEPGPAALEQDNNNQGDRNHNHRQVQGCTHLVGTSLRRAGRL